MHTIHTQQDQVTKIAIEFEPGAGVDEFYYLAPDEKAVMNVLALKKFAENCHSYYSDFLPQLYKMQNQLEIKAQDFIDPSDPKKIIPARSTTFKSGTRHFYHYHDGVPYNFLNRACCYSIDDQNRLYMASRFDPEAYSIIDLPDFKKVDLDDIELAVFSAHYAHYQNQADLFRTQGLEMQPFDPALLASANADAARLKL